MAVQRVWVAFDTADARSLLRGERVWYAHHPTNRSVRNLLRNFVLAVRLIRQVRPRAVVTTGVGALTSARFRPVVLHLARLAIRSD